MRGDSDADGNLGKDYINGIGSEQRCYCYVKNMRQLRQLLWQRPDIDSWWNQFVKGRINTNAGWILREAHLRSCLASLGTHRPHTHQHRGRHTNTHQDRMGANTHQHRYGADTPRQEGNRWGPFVESKGKAYLTDVKDIRYKIGLYKQSKTNHNFKLKALVQRQQKRPIERY